MFRFGIFVCICYTENQLLRTERTTKWQYFITYWLVIFFRVCWIHARVIQHICKKIMNVKKIWEKTQWQVYNFHVDKQCYRHTSIDLVSLSIFITLCPLYLNLCRDKNKVNNKITGCLLLEWNTSTWNHLSVLINITFLTRRRNDIQYCR